MKNLRTVFYSTLIVLLFLASRQLFLQSGMTYALYPFLILQKKIVHPIKKLMSNPDPENLRSLVEHYKKENDYFQSQLIEFYAIKAYADSIDELKQFSLRYDLKNYIISQVLLKNFDPDQHFILIDAGSNKGVQEDMVVIHNNCLVGKVSEVYKYYSKVTLITDKTCKVAAYCVSHNVKSIHVGQNDLEKSKLTFVNHLDTVTEGDLVLSSGEGIIFPKGFALGRVDNTHKEDFNYLIDVKPLIDFTTLDYCCVIQKGSEIKESIKKPQEALPDLPQISISNIEPIVEKVEKEETQTPESKVDQSDSDIPLLTRKKRIRKKVAKSNSISLSRTPAAELRT